MNHLTISLLLSILLISTSFQIKNIKHQLPIQNPAQYVQYIQALNGLATTDDLKTNQKLSDIVTDERISFLNAVENVVLVLVDQINEDNDNLPSIDDLKTLTGIEDLIKSFDIVDLAQFNEETLALKLKQLQNSGKIIHTLEISQQLAQQLQTHSQRKLLQTKSKESSLEEESSESVYEASQEMTHKQKPIKVTNEANNNPTYILKFFFGFMFIIVSLGSLMAIANMENRKDTLLYAKFIADVGTR